jgi:metal-responsive CopG/Arc/MetJ family transcriptional regulator
LEDKVKYETVLDEVRMIMGGKSRSDFVDEAIGQLIKRAEKQKILNMSSIIQRLKEGK